MKSRLIKQLIHREVDMARNASLVEQREASVDLENTGVIDEGRYSSASSVLKPMKRDIYPTITKCHKKRS